MAVRRGVWIVLVLIILAVAISAMGAGRDGPVRRARAAGGRQLDAGPEGWRRPPRDGAYRRHRSVLRSTADGSFRGRVAAQGQGGQACRQRHHPANRCGGAVGQDPGSPGRDHRLPAFRKADHRLPRVRRRAGVLSCQRLRQGLPHADLVARLDRHGELRAVPARHTRQDWRLPRHHAHRGIQDGLQHVHRAHLYSGASRDGRVAQLRSLRTADSRHRQRPSQVREGRPRARRSRPVPP